MAGDGGRRWEGARYAEAAGHHRVHDDWFLDQHPPRIGDDVIDVGCGSGEFTARLAEVASRGRVVGVDPDPSMLEVAARHELPNLTFRAGRVQDLDRVCGEASADLVVSRAMFHWLPLDAYPASYAAVRRVLRPGGWFHAESGGAGNVARVERLLDEVAAELGTGPSRVTFPDAGQALELLEAVGFETPPSAVTTVAQRRRFDHEQLLGFLRTQATLAYDTGGSPELARRFLDAVVARIDELRRHDGTYDQTFVRLHVRCRVPAAGG